MLYLKHSKIQFNFSFGFRLFQIARKNIRYNLTTSLQQGLSFRIVSDIGNARNHSRQFPYFNKCINDIYRSLRCLFCLQYGSKHIKATFCKRSRIDWAEFEFFEVVKIFYHLFLFFIRGLNYVTGRKLLGVISNSLVDFFSWHAIQSGHIAIQNYTFITDCHYFTFYILHKFSIRLQAKKATLTFSQNNIDYSNVKR